MCLVIAVPKFAGTWLILSPELSSSCALKKIAFFFKIIPSFRHVPSLLRSFFFFFFSLYLRSIMSDMFIAAGAPLGKFFVAT
jgi:hypothetical protein